jgi:hypothetical protein
VSNPAASYELPLWRRYFDLAASDFAALIQRNNVPLKPSLVGFFRAMARMGTAGRVRLSASALEPAVVQLAYPETAFLIGHLQRERESQAAFSCTEAATVLGLIIERLETHAAHLDEILGDDFKLLEVERMERAMDCLTAVVA